MTLEEYTELTVQLVQSYITSTLRPVMTAAALGEHLRRASQDTSWRTFGFATFLRYLESLERLRKLSLTKTDRQALAVSMPDDNAQNSVPAPVYNPLRKPVWSALVFSAPPGRRFLHRTSGLVRMGLQSPPSPADEWVEIDLISDPVLKGWARDFLKSEDISDPQILRSIDETHWHLVFPQSLERLGQSMRIRWNRFRSSKVAQFAQDWCTRNKVDLHTVFQTAETPPPAGANVAPIHSRRADDAQRHWILAALATLPTETLLSLPIPAGAMIKTRPDNIAAHG